LLKKSLRFGGDADDGVHVDHSEVCQVVAIVAIDKHVYGEDLFIEKNLDLMRLAGLLQLVEEFLGPLLLHFLSIWGQKQPLDDHRALHTQAVANHVPHCPWAHLMMLPHASLRIFSDSCLDCGDGGGNPDDKFYYL
jgi:hypothetical protein